MLDFPDVFGAIRSLARRERPYGRELRELSQAVLIGCFLICLVMAVVCVFVVLPMWLFLGMLSLVIALIISSEFMFRVGGRIIDEHEANGVYEYVYPERYRSR